MNRAKIITLLLVCLSNGVPAHLAANQPINAHEVDALLHDKHVDAQESHDFTAALGSAMALDESPPTDLEIRIAVMQQQLADRDEIILQLAEDAARAAEAESLQEENKLLSDKLQHVRAERDQIRNDFARMLEQGEGFMPDPTLAADAMAEHDVFQGRIPQLETRIADLQDALAESERIRSEQESDLELLQVELMEREEELVQTGETKEDLQVSLAGAQETIKEQESDLERLQVELMQREEELVQTEDSKEDALSSLLLAEDRAEEYTQLLEEKIAEVQTLEGNVTELREERELLSARVKQQDDQIAELHIELDQREHRLARAARVAEVLDRTRAEIEASRRQQRLNMHYNMAAVHRQEGRYEEAEYAYLQALRLDPTDSYVHYHLGVLYDDSLEEPDKAMMHYRRYLQLNPDGTDTDLVRSSLMRLEMDQHQ